MTSQDWVDLEKNERFIRMNLYEILERGSLAIEWKYGGGSSAGQCQCLRDELTACPESMMMMIPIIIVRQVTVSNSWLSRPANGR
jgi:hypothetical protein